MPTTLPASSNTTSTASFSSNPYAFTLAVSVTGDSSKELCSERTSSTERSRCTGPFPMTTGNTGARLDRTFSQFAASGVTPSVKTTTAAVARPPERSPIDFKAETRAEPRPSNFNPEKSLTLFSRSSNTIDFTRNNSSSSSFHLPERASLIALPLATSPVFSATVIRAPLSAAMTTSLAPFRGTILVHWGSSSISARRLNALNLHTIARTFLTRGNGLCR